MLSPNSCERTFISCTPKCSHKHLPIMSYPRGGHPHTTTPMCILINRHPYLQACTHPCCTWPYTVTPKRTHTHNYTNVCTQTQASTSMHTFLLHLDLYHHTRRGTHSHNHTNVCTQTQASTSMHTLLLHLDLYRHAQRTHSHNHTTVCTHTQISISMNTQSAHSHCTRTAYTRAHTYMHI